MIQLKKYKNNFQDRLMKYTNKIHNLYGLTSIMIHRVVKSGIFSKYITVYSNKYPKKNKDKITFI